MVRLLLLSVLACSVSTLPVLGEGGAPGVGGAPSEGGAPGEGGVPLRTPWKKADPASEEVVRWVVEGCAAYPVTVADMAAPPVSAIDPRAAAALPTPARAPLAER